MKDKKVVTDRLLEEFYPPTSHCLFILPVAGPPGNQPKVVQIPGVPLHKNVLEVDRISWIAWVYFCTCLPVSTDVWCNFTVRLIKQLHVWDAANWGYEITVPYRISCILVHKVIMGNRSPALAAAHSSPGSLVLWCDAEEFCMWLCIWHLMTLQQDYECNAAISNSCQKTCYLLHHMIG